jgi:hypothetical protein
LCLKFNLGKLARAIAAACWSYSRKRGRHGYALAYDSLGFFISTFR